jgi:hypothetical protein
MPGYQAFSQDRSPVKDFVGQGFPSCDLLRSKESAPKGLPVSLATRYLY